MAKKEKKIGRRRFLKAAGGGAAVLTVAGWIYLDDVEMVPAPTIDGKVLCDLHTHPAADQTIGELSDFLGSPGLAGLAQKYGNTEVLTYEMAFSRLRKLVGDSPVLREITPGQLFKYQEGYALREQELKGGIFDFIALGWQGDYIPNCDVAVEAPKTVIARGGRSILSSPNTVPGGMAFRVANEEERRQIVPLLDYVVEVEVHNATNIDYFGINMKESNRLSALMIKEDVRFQGIAASDGRRSNDQMKICGIYIDKELIDKYGTKGIIYALENKAFVRYGEPGIGPYISKWSFTKNMVLPMIGRKIGF